MCRDSAHVCITHLNRLRSAFNLASTPFKRLKSSTVHSVPISYAIFGSIFGAFYPRLFKILWWRISRISTDRDSFPNLLNTIQWEPCSEYPWTSLLLSPSRERLGSKESRFETFTTGESHWRIALQNRIEISNVMRLFWLVVGDHLNHKNSNYAKEFYRFFNFQLLMTPGSIRRKPIGV